MAWKSFLTACGLSMAIVLSFSIPSTSLAQSQNPSCRPDQEAALQHFADNYGEVPVAAGVTSAGSLLQVLASPDGGSWSIIITAADKSRTCLVSSGEGWRGQSPTVADDPGA